jgi:hypothetical protein
VDAALFVPTIIAFQQLPDAATVDPALVAKAARWRSLNYLRPHGASVYHGAAPGHSGR